ncbi:transglycosylase domain-containing protein [Anabaena subtropica]|uniref:Penicillin-binding protein 1A n=1 Tax=Anabaena subtropica FACHB-260 TaxID=2692884 RepID=A0ABR8CPA3_9NOST|nr:penicillin-binding protein 1A [Anabaena subtropica]MBD2344874.1 penicillin-binding protein 1A [Anabaena subtropica FACHB-260]
MPPSNRYEQQESTNESLPPTKVVRPNKLLNRIGGLTSGIVSGFTSRQQPIYRRLWFWAGLSVGGGIIAFTYLLGEIDRSLPDKSELQAVVREQTITIKAVDGSILQQQGEATREKLNLEQIPDTLKNAFIASEDSRFGQHEGIDAPGIIRAAINNLRSQNVVEGGSTITQQLVRILFLKHERTIWRKLKEMRLAQKLEQELTKEQILERYLNLVYLGAGAYGVADAAWVYFSKPVDQLTLDEAAMIAGLPPAPSLFSPDRSPEAARKRRNLVLQRMETEGFITSAQKQAAMQKAITLKSSLPKRLQVESPYFSTYIQQELPKYVSPEVLATGGLTVETTLNPTWQAAAEAAVAKTLKNQGRWQNFRQAALVAIDPRNGQIQAMVGGRDFGKNQFNRVTQAKRQPGSTFKGFLYATAIATGRSPYDTYLDAPFVVDGYEPKNYGETFRGMMNMRDALTRSVNVVALKVMLDVGFEPTIQTAKNMGIKSQLNPHYSLALGSNEVNLLELTSAYGSFATQGLHSEPHGIRRILNRKGDVIWSAKFDSQRVLDPTSAAIMTWMLRNVVDSGTGAAARLPNRPVAGKTGTSDEARDLWFIGYIPQLVTGVWLGNDDNRPTSGGSGSAASTWHEFMKQAVEEMPVEKFPERPKLEGRKGSIKAKPIKPKQILHRSLKSDPEAVQDTSSSTRRRRRNQQLEQNTPTDSPRRRRRRSSSQESGSSVSENTSRTRRQNRVAESNTPVPRRDRRSSSLRSSSSSSANSSTPKPSWRDRLRPMPSSSD